MARKLLKEKSLHRKAEASSRPAKDAKAKPAAAKSAPMKAVAKPAKDAKDSKVVKGKADKGPDKGPDKGKGEKEPKAKDAKKEGAKVAAKAVAPAAPPKKKRSKAGVVRLKAYWGVFNQMMKRVAVFEYAERKQADKKAADLSTSSKAGHFVQLVKEVIREE